MNKLIKVAIADDHRLMRQAITCLFEKMEGVEMIGEVASGEDAVNFAWEHKPDVFLLDIIMAGMSGIEATRWIKEQNPRMKIILISGQVNKEFISDGIKSGIDGYLDKDVDQATLQNAIQTVFSGRRFFSPEIKALVFQDIYLKEKSIHHKMKAVLSKREEQVLTQIALGKSLKEIADVLFISVKTVETHKQHIQDKLGLSNTAQLVKFAIKNKLIEIIKKA